MPLSPRLASFLEGVNALAIRMKARGIEPTPETAREAMTALCRYLPPPQPIAWTQDRSVRYNGLTVPVRLYSPRPHDALPVLVFFHGGGHMCGNIDLYDPIIRKLSITADVIVVAVDYRKAPENPYPAGLKDCQAVIENVWEVVADIGHRQQLFVAGDSAGGALAASIVMERLGAVAPAIDKQVLIYPSLDYTLSSESITRLENGYLLEAEKIQWYFNHYFQNGEDRHKASPLFGPYSSNMPATLVVTAELDPLRDEGFAYYQQVKDHGNDAEYREFAGMIHAFMNLETLVRQDTDDVYQCAANFLNSD